MMRNVAPEMAASYHRHAKVLARVVLKRAFSLKGVSRKQQVDEPFSFVGVVGRAALRHGRVMDKSSRRGSYTHRPGTGRPPLSSLVFGVS